MFCFFFQKYEIETFNLIIIDVYYFEKLHEKHPTLNLFYVNKNAFTFSVQDLVNHGIYGQ